MPRLVLIAKSTHVWLDQLSRTYGRDIRTLDAIPDEELDRLARLGITGPLAHRPVGALEGAASGSRSGAATRTRRRPPTRSTTTAIADDLGGEDAWANLRHRAWQRGIRLASDMVPNHMGIDSRWVMDHPDWFLSLPEPPYPAYAVQRREPGRARPGRDPPRGPLLGQQRRGRRRSSGATAGRASAATSTTATTAPASPGTTPRSWTSARAGRPRAGHPDDPRRRPPVPGDPVRRRDGPRQAPRPPAVVPGPRRGRRGDPVARRVRDDDGGRVRGGDARRVLARGRGPGGGRGARHAAARRGVLDAGGLLRPDPGHAPRLQQRLHAHAPRRGQRGLPAASSRRPWSSTRRSSSATSTS